MSTNRRVGTAHTVHPVAVPTLRLLLLYSPEKTMATLFERIGGDAAVAAAVDRFYEIVLADDRIRHFFAGVDMKQQTAHMKLFLKFAFGGSSTYPGRAMRTAHARLVQDLGLTDAHFDAVLDDLAKALRGLGVAEDMIAEVLAIAETVRNDVLGRG